MDKGRKLFAQIEAQGRKVTDMRFGDCGYYPLKEGDEGHDGCSSFPYLIGDGREPYFNTHRHDYYLLCFDDIEKWVNREAFERVLENTPPGTPVDYDDCVRCWRDKDKTGCFCKDGGVFLPEGWSTEVTVIGNPGVPIRVDVETTSGMNVTWSTPIPEMPQRHWISSHVSPTTDEETAKGSNPDAV